MLMFLIEKMKRMLTNVRRARLALSEESKELEQLVAEQRTMIIQMRKTSTRDAAVINSVHGATGHGSDRTRSLGRRNMPFEKENTQNYELNRDREMHPSMRNNQYESKSSPSNHTAPPVLLEAEEPKYRQEALERQQRLDDELAAPRASKRVRL